MIRVKITENGQTRVLRLLARGVNSDYRPGVLSDRRLHVPESTGARVTILPKLFSIFRGAGYQPLTGYSPSHFYNCREAPFTHFLHENQLRGCPGLALQEIMFIEQFRDFVAPKRILIVGNALGWSTIALALVFPAAKTVAIDIDTDGIDFTNRLIATHGLSARAVTARSPDDVAVVVREHLGGLIDFSLIDAVHTDEALLADFAAVHAMSDQRAFYLLHDVINWNMTAGVQTLVTRYELTTKILTRTASGMALAYKALSPEFEAYLECFAEPAGVFAKLRNAYLENYVDPIRAFSTAARRAQ